MATYSMLTCTVSLAQSIPRNAGQLCSSYTNCYTLRFTNQWQRVVKEVWTVRSMSTFTTNHPVKSIQTCKQWRLDTFHTLPPTQHSPFTNTCPFAFFCSSLTSAQIKKQTNNPPFKKKFNCHHSYHWAFLGLIFFLVGDESAVVSSW